MVLAGHAGARDLVRTTSQACGELWLFGARKAPLVHPAGKSPQKPGGCRRAAQLQQVAMFPPSSQRGAGAGPLTTVYLYTAEGPRSAAEVFVQH